MYCLCVWFCDVTHRSLCRAYAAVFGIRFRRVSGVRRFIQKFRALIVKHVIHSRRNIIVTLVQVLIPVLYAVIACVVEKTIDKPSDSPPLSLDQRHFDNPFVAMSYDASSSGNTAALAAAYSMIAAEHGRVVNIGNVDMDTYLLKILRDVDSGNRYHIIAGTVEHLQVTAGDRQMCLWNFKFIGLESLFWFGSVPLSSGM